MRAMSWSAFAPDLTPERIVEFRNRDRYIEHAGQKILLHDFTDLDGDAAAQLVLWCANNMIARGDRDLLVLTDVTGAYGNKDAIAAFKKATYRTRFYCKKTAVVGARGVVKFFLDLIVRFSGFENTREFETREEALAWLTTEPRKPRVSPHHRRRAAEFRLSGGNEQSALSGRTAGT